MSDLTIFESLTILNLEGFAPTGEPEGDDAGPSDDQPGSVNWLCEGYGMGGDSPFSGPGILFEERESSGDWGFSVLISSDEAEALRRFAEEAGYSVSREEVVTEPLRFGDGHAGTVEILRHREGWVLIEG